MLWDDIVYLSLLFMSIGFGKILRSVGCPNIRKNISTSVGVMIILIVSGKHFLHPLIFTTVNAALITSLSKRYIHSVCFAFSFLYLIFFRTTIYFGIPYPPAHTNLVMMILALKMIGLAFEVHDQLEFKKKSEPSDNGKRSIDIPTATDIFHYSFSYIGVLTGPYYTYRMFCDWLTMPFWKYTDCESISLKRFMYLPLYAVVFLTFNHLFPFGYAQSDKFYLETNVLYRLWYVWPLFVQFRMRMYIGMRLSESVLTMAGVGTYPEICEPKPFEGPTKHISEMQKLAQDEEKAGSQKYNLVAAYNIEPFDCEFDPTVRASMKAWNISVQYWLAAYVYHRFPLKAYRTLVTFFISALWHGVYAGYYCTICSVPLYLPIEDIYRRNLRNVTFTPLVYKVGRILANQWRIYIMAYWAIAFRLLTFNDSIRYWSSIYFIPTIITFLMYALSFFIFGKSKQHKSEQITSPTKKMS